MNNNYETGFTLTELIVFIALAGIIILILGNLNLSLWKIWSINQDKTTLTREVIVINRNFEKDIRKTKYMKIESPDEIEDDILYLNLGELGSHRQKDYCRYRIDNNQLVLQKPVSDFNLQNDWPDSWKVINTISSLEISNLIFNEKNDAVEIKLTIKHGDKEEKLFNKFYPRLSNQ